MDKDLNDSDFQNLSVSQDNENGQSLVGKFKRNVSEIINNTPLSKWFKKQSDTPSSALRKRQDDSDDETDLQEFQPPTKRTKLPPTKETLSLNVSEVLSPISKVSDGKKPLFAKFPEPIPGPSGYQTRKMLNSTSFTSDSAFKHAKTTSERNTVDVFKNPKNVLSDRLATNGNKQINISDSEESTSGYSSGRIGSKEVISQESSKHTSPLENSPLKSRSLFHSSSSGRSLFSGPTASPSRHTSLSKRLPSFDPTTFGSPSFVDRTLTTEKILNSPFYSGRTVYGGASAYGRSSGRTPQDLKRSLRQSIRIKPVNKGIEKGDMQLGKTARRILDTLEQYSSPVSDAKKIPIASKKMKSEGSLTKYIGVNPYTLRPSKSNASNKELQVPSVTDFLRMKIDQQKSRLQDSTETVRQIATSSKSVLNETTYHLAVHNDRDKQHTGKMKTKITSVRHKPQAEETVPELQLNPVALPIKDIPKFDFVVPPPATTEPKKRDSPVKSIFSKPSELKTAPSQPPLTSQKVVVAENVKDNEVQFKFSAPLVLAECLKPIKALNNYKFSEPLVKKRRSIHPELNSSESSAESKTKKNNGENVPSVSNASSPGTSLMEKFKPKEGTWECSVCMIRNQGDKQKCLACESPRSSLDKKPITDPKPSFIMPKTTDPTPLSSSFGAQFKAPANTWECTTCCIRNKEDCSKCLACETPRPKSKDQAKPETNASASVQSSFGSKFAPPPNTWECSSCMLRNNENLNKCIACETPKPGSKSQPSPAPTFGADFTKKNDEWECGVCLVKNKKTASKCLCCENPNPSTTSTISLPPTTSASSKLTFSFGIDQSTANSFTFGVPPASQSDAPKTNASLVFGQSKVDGEAPEAPTKNPPAFSFGVPSKPEAKPVVSTSTVEEKKSSEKLSISTTPAPAISFGAVPAVPVSGFTVAASSKPTETPNKVEEKKEEVKNVNPLLKPGEKLPEKAVAASAGFSFGLPKPPAIQTPTVSAPKAEKRPADDEAPSKKIKKPSQASDLAAVPSFTFKAPTTNGDTNTTVAFGKAPAPSKATSQTPAGFSFTFDSAQKTTSAVTNTTTNPTFSFAAASASTTTADTSKPAPMFKFTPESSVVAKPTNGFSFGASAPVFGSKPTSTAAAGSDKTFVFGGSSASTPAPSTSSAAPPKAPMFQFNAPDNKAQNKASLFSFNQPDTKQASFTFGSSNVASSSSNPSGGFGFGQATTAPAAPFTFGAASATKDTGFGGLGASGVSTTTNHFGSNAKAAETTGFGAATPGQSTAQNGMFNFGSGASASQKAGFNFGSASDANGQPGARWNSETPSEPSSSFKFNAPASFDATAKPMFNFTGGNNTPTFSAPPPQDGTMPKRVIKKAIRRTVR